VARLPGLPDLEVFKTNIYNRLTSKLLIGVNVFNRNKALTPEPFLNGELSGRNLLCIERVGKELFFDFGDQKIIAAHLMLSGQISIVPEQQAGEVKYKIFTMRFENETMIFSDKGRLCTVRYMPRVTRAPDALAEKFTLDYFVKKARGKHMTNIKAFLTDQSVVKGIGNAYADEILWAARISPYSLVDRVPEDRVIILYGAIGTVLNDAIASIKRISPDIISGEERSFLKVHNKDLTHTETGYPIRVERILSRITYFTDEQILY